MNIQARTGARLLFRVEPFPLESPRGYLCRAAQMHGYRSARWLAAIAGVLPAALEREDRARQIAYVLRLEPEEWLAMCYRRVMGRGRFEQRLFNGERLSSDHLNYGRPRICPRCLRERVVWWAVWDLGLVSACPIHRRLLLNQCPACKKRLAWHRPAVHECRCGLDFRTLTAEAANDDLVAINAAIYRAAGFPLGQAAEVESNRYGFPSEMLRLRLGSLLGLVQFVGTVCGSDMLRRKQRPFPSTNLSAATEIGQAAVKMLSDWPRPLHEMLRRTVPKEPGDPAALRFNDTFGNFYRHLFRVLPRSECGFLRDAFERFVIEDWKGVVRGQHRFFSVVTRRNSQWMTAHEAERTARTQAQRMVDLVRTGELEGMFIQRGRLYECWIRRESLNRWIARRNAELARYLSRPEAKRALGLAKCTILNVAAAGLIRCIEGAAQNFPSGFFFLREDVMKIKHAFEGYAVPALEYSTPGEFIALRHAVKNYLGRDSGLAAVIRAVVDGSLVPVGYTKRFPGITGYLFRATDLRMYRPVSDAKVPPDGFLNYREAASILETKTEVIRGLVARGVLSAPTEHRNGFSKLVPAGDVQRFAEAFVAVAVLAKRFNLDGRSLSRYLRESGTPVLAVSIPAKGRALFVQKEFAAQVRIPSSPAL